MKIKPIKGAAFSIRGIIQEGEYYDKQFEVKMQEQGHKCEVKIDGKPIELLKRVTITMEVDRPTIIELEGLTG